MTKRSEMPIDQAFFFFSGHALVNHHDWRRCERDSTAMDQGSLTRMRQYLFGVWACYEATVFEGVECELDLDSRGRGTPGMSRNLVDNGSAAIWSSPLAVAMRVNLRTMRHVYIFIFRSITTSVSATCRRTRSNDNYDKHLYFFHARVPLI